MFCIGVQPPDERLLPAITHRKSQDLTVSGPEGGFENFLESLEATVGHYKEHRSYPAPVTQPSRGKSSYLTTLESKGLSECLKVALRIRALMNVADSSEIGIEQHGDELFNLCLTLARNAGISLTSPEKYLISCASYLHDLGYFRAYSGGKASEHPGWGLLQRHGELTAELLEKYLTGPDKANLVPDSYNSASDDKFVAMLIELCRRHTFFWFKLEHSSSFNPRTDTLVIGKQPRYEVTVRFNLLHAIFVTAEEISTGHPFLPSADPVEPAVHGRLHSIDDPVLDIYLRRKGSEVEFSSDRGAIHAKVITGASSRVVDWLMVLADRAVKYLDQVVRDNDGEGIHFQSDRSLPDRSNEELLCLALEQVLEEALDNVETSSAGAERYLLDLIALYTLAPNPSDPHEPRVSLGSQAVGKGLTKYSACNSTPHEGLLHIYIPLLIRGASSVMEKRFCKDFQSIYLPAWRFCAQSWRRGIAPIIMACSSLDLGSTPLRSEVTSGLRYLLLETILPGITILPDIKKSLARGHSGCTLCTSRLLYILSYARLFFQPQELKLKVAGATYDLDEIIRFLINYMLQPKPREAWWGIEDEVRGQRPGIQSADYAAWAVRSIAFCLWVDSRFSDPEGTPLGKELRHALRTLFRQIWTDLCGASADSLLSQRSEEPHSYILGETARAYLSIQRLRHLPDGDLLEEGSMELARENMEGALERLSLGELSQLSQFYLLPANVFLHSRTTDPGQRQKLAEQIKDTYERCASSSIWIQSGEDAGSWGYNMENTARLVLALSTFWRYSFECREEFEPLLIE